jgi:hypothetical protein
MVIFKFKNKINHSTSLSITINVKKDTTHYNLQFASCKTSAWISQSLRIVVGRQNEPPPGVDVGRRGVVAVCVCAVN